MDKTSRGRQPFPTADEEPGFRPVRGPRLTPLAMDQDDQRVVLQVLPDAGQVDPRLDTAFAQVVGLQQGGSFSLLTEDAAIRLLNMNAEERLRVRRELLQRGDL